MNEDILEDPQFQREMNRAIKIMDIVAKLSDDNRAEFTYKRDGINMRIVAEEATDD